MIRIQEGHEDECTHTRRQPVLEGLELEFGPTSDGILDSLDAIASPEKLRALLRAAFVSVSQETVSATL